MECMCLRWNSNQLNGEQIVLGSNSIAGGAYNSGCYGILRNVERTRNIAKRNGRNGNARRRRVERPKVDDKRVVKTYCRRGIVKSKESTIAVIAIGEE